MIEKMLKDKLLETKLMMSHERRNEIRKHLDYYSGVSTDQYITRYFKGDAFMLKIYNGSIGITRSMALLMKMVK